MFVDLTDAPPPPDGEPTNTMIAEFKIGGGGMTEEIGLLVIFTTSSWNTLQLATFLAPRHPDAPWATSWLCSVRDQGGPNGSWNVDLLYPDDASELLVAMVRDAIGEIIDAMGPDFMSRAVTLGPTVTE
jgi:hypothetical protein